MSVTTLTLVFILITPPVVRRLTHKPLYSVSRGAYTIPPISLYFALLACYFLNLLIATSSLKINGTYFYLVLFAVGPQALDYLVILYNRKPFASVPGGPVSKHVTMRPQAFNSRTFSSSSSHFANHENYRAVANKQSHAHTNNLLQQYLSSNNITSISISDIALTGEPAGRVIWSYISPKNPERRLSYHSPLALGSMLQLPLTSPYTSSLTAGGRDNCYVFDPSTNVNSADHIYRGLMFESYINTYNGIRTMPDLRSVPVTPLDACRKGIDFYKMLQLNDSGHWSGDYSGPHFLLPGYVVSCYILTKTHPSLAELVLPPWKKEGMRDYMRNHQQDNGGWGSHIESPETCFGTTMQYIALRLLGEPPDSVCMIKAKDWLSKQGGGIYTASWCKFYMSLLGVMKWDGVNSIPPEMFLLPNWFPFHPGRMWCHARMVYLPMSYLYGHRYVYENADADPIILALRQELYNEDYDSIDFSSTRHYVADIDNYSPVGMLMKTAHNFLQIYETSSLFKPFKNFVRKRGLEFVRDYMEAEDIQTNYINIGPVSKVLNMICTMHQIVPETETGTATATATATPGVSVSVQLLKHVGRLDDYLWVAEDGVKMQGYNGSQCWDTSFAIQGIYEAGLLDEFEEVAEKCYGFFERTQILSTQESQNTMAFKFEDPKLRDKYYRHVSQGGWPFSTSAHGWPISDCTGEGLKAVLALHKSASIAEKIRNKSITNVVTFERMCNAVNVILELQNVDGGFATYENNRGYGWYEWLNPSEVFGDIMIDYSYVECTMASVTALADFRAQYPQHRAEEIANALKRAGKFIKQIQRKDGSWYGSWACCFCYAAWFGIEGLVACGEDPAAAHSIVIACEFLKEKQCENGGWGEDFRSCYNRDYSDGGMAKLGDEQGACVINTAWAVMALLAGGQGGSESVQRGVKYLMARQLNTGDWPQEGISGVFNRACGITYTSYRNAFPIWALGRYEKYQKTAATAAT
jgi:squalene/oxidosqualene cyclase-like protein